MNCCPKILISELSRKKINTFLQRMAEKALQNASEWMQKPKSFTDKGLNVAKSHHFAQLHVRILQWKAEK